MIKQLGIIFTGGQGPGPDSIRNVVDSLETGVLMAAADSGLHLAEAAGLKPHWIVGDMDSLDIGRLENYPGGTVVRHPADKDYTDTELALTLLWEKGCDEVWIIGGGGGRIDHLFGIRDLFEREQPPRRWITAAEDIYCIDCSFAGSLAGSLAGKAAGSLDLALEPGSLVSVFTLGAGPWKAESRGLKWALDDVHWERGLYGLSNVTIEEALHINTTQGRFMIVLNI